MNGSMFFLRWIILSNVTIILTVSLRGELSPPAMQVRDGLPYLSKIIINNDSVLFSDSGSQEQGSVISRRIKLDRAHNNISFAISSKDSVGYQYFLEGFDSSPTPVRNSGYKEYTNLPSGRYIFNAIYYGQDGVSHRLTPVSFRVLPFWYLSPVAISIYILLLAAVVWFLYEQMNYRFAHGKYMLEQIINKRTEDLILEKEKSDALLANVLPKSMADEIMSKGKAEKVKYNFVTVLFSDIQGFTKIAEEMNPEILIDELDKFFFHFDSVVEKYGIEKIKTIGDAYMCAGGIPEKNRTNPVEVILAALEMQQYMNMFKITAGDTGLKYWDIRIGIHTGTVVAGVIGHKKLSYDIWGDTVNTASRMESAGEAGKINISGTTYEFVKDFFTCEHRGKMPVKYKGELDMYFVTGITPGLCDSDNRPNRDFFIKMQSLKLLDVEELVLKMFDEEASPNLYFHNSSLVRNICTQAELLATAEGVPEEEYISLRLAAVFLFTGYITDYEKPMEASCRFAEEILPRYGFDQKSISETLRLIRGSYMNVMDKLTDMILHDARYAYLGRVDYKKLSEKLFRELKEYGRIQDDVSWTEIRKKQLREHEFLTNTARLLRNVSSFDQINSLESDKG